MTPFNKAGGGQGDLPAGGGVEEPELFFIDVP